MAAKFQEGREKFAAFESYMVFRPSNTDSFICEKKILGEGEMLF